MARKPAAIPADSKVLDRELGQLSAADFLQILGRPDFDRGVVALLPDKKKYELWVDESGLPKITVRDLLERMRREKKKLELEKLRIEDLKLAVEFDFDPTHRIDPRIIEDIASRVAAKLRGMG